MSVEIALDAITVDLSIQPRANGIDQETADEYAEAVRNGTKFPDVVVYDTGTEKLLSEGFHRYEGHKRAGSKTINADVRSGTRKDAIANGLASNQSHGLKRTVADKRQAVQLGLKTFPEWSNRRIADKVGVSNRMVDSLREELEGAGEILPVEERQDKRGRSQPAHKDPGGKLSHQEEVEPAQPAHKDPGGKLSHQEEVEPGTQPAQIDQPEDRIPPDAPDAVVLAPEAPTEVPTTATAPKPPAKQKVLCERCQRVGVTPDCDGCKLARQTAKVMAKPEPEVEETMDDVIRAKNGELESWCKQLMKFAETMPQDPWLDDLGRRDGAIAKLKACCETIRSAKCHAVCPKCEGNGCKPCRNTGRAPLAALQLMGAK